MIMNNHWKDYLKNLERSKMDSCPRKTSLRNKMSRIKINQTGKPRMMMMRRRMNPPANQKIEYFP
jgi:hypothetical protein